jgi:hypothetical protein
MWHVADVRFGGVCESYCLIVVVVVDGVIGDGEYNILMIMIVATA